MTNEKFKLGDRVRVLVQPDADYPPVGSTGTVVVLESDGISGIRVDGWKGRGVVLRGALPEQDGVWFGQEKLELIESETTPKPIPTYSEMNLRDQFAMAALTGLLAAGEVTGGVGSPSVRQAFAASAYVLADAMLEERAKKEAKA